MNNEQRKILDRVFAAIESAQSELEAVRTDEQDKLDNMPESFRGGERGEKQEEIVNALDEAYDSMQGALDAIETARGA